MIFKIDLPDYIKPYLIEDKNTNNWIWKLSYVLRESPLPRQTRRKIINSIRGIPKLPKKDPELVSVGGIDCKFLINNVPDWERLTRPDYEGDFAYWVTGNIKSGNVFWDIGAAQGLYSIPAGLIGAKVIAFEPDTESFKELVKNVQLNHVGKSVECLNIAVDSRNSPTKLYTEGIDGDSPSLRHVNKNEETVSVNCYTIDFLINYKRFQVPTIIKIDTEGHEIEILKGGQKTFGLKNKPKHLLIEIHPVYLENFYESSFDELWNMVTKKYLYIPLKIIALHPNRLMCHFVSQV